MNRYEFNEVIIDRLNLKEDVYIISVTLTSKSSTVHFMTPDKKKELQLSLDECKRLFNIEDKSQVIESSAADLYYELLAISEEG